MGAACQARVLARIPAERRRPREGGQRRRARARPPARDPRARRRAEPPQRRHQGPAVGSLTDECWSDCDPDELLKDRRGEVPSLETAHHTFIGASLFSDPEHPLGRITGDLLVRRPSAWGGGLHGEHGQFRLDSSHHVGPANHFALLNHPDVYAQIERQLRADRGLYSGAPGAMALG